MSNHPSFPSTPSGGGESRQKAWQKFSQSMGPLWRVAHAMLTRQKPKSWSGYRCMVEAKKNPSTGQYSLQASFRDAASTGSKLLSSQAFHELIASLHEAYRLFDDQIEWRKVTLEQFWDEREKKWCDRTEWEYGQTILETGSDNDPKLGLS